VKVFTLTDIPSPYQVELFNEIESRDGIDLSVAYLRDRDPQRQWQPAQAQYECWTMSESPAAFSAVERASQNADLSIFNYYNHPLAEALLARRAESGRPWCFWGERPGLRKPQFAGAWFRKWKLKPLRRSQTPIWGIGEFALARYRVEFGAQRAYRNLPYFSNLDRFAVERGRDSARRVFLFVGSLIQRKGVDLVARAFVRVAREFPNVSLKIAGAGGLEKMVAETVNSVRERVEFVGFKSWNELPELYASADVLSVPSRYDGWGLVVPEGLAARLPVIATDQMGAALEFVQTGNNGWLIPAANEAAIYNALREAAMLPKVELDQLGRRAQASVSEHTLAHGAERFVRYAREGLHV
jgi:glycosyltransferase involved in cell wall biosynthesis